MKKRLAGVAFLGLGLAWAGGGAVSYEKDLPAAKEKAAKEGKAILVNFGGDW